MDQRAIAQAAGNLSRARLQGTTLTELDEHLRPRDEAQAYAVQAALHLRLTAAGRGEVTGYKIGCTTPVMQKFLGIGNPCAGGVFEPTVLSERGTAAHGDYLHVGVECELAVRLGRDLRGPLATTQEAADQAVAAVAAVMPAIEIVDDRWQDYRAISAPTLIADDFFGAGCVLGTERADVEPSALASVRGRMRIGGNTVGEGCGGDIMGHPLNALVWLTNALHAQGTSLEGGQFVLLGSLVQTVWVKRGDEVEIEIDGVGGAALVFE